jgi:hypothetical protein
VVERQLEHERAPDRVADSRVGAGQLVVEPGAEPLVEGEPGLDLVPDREAGRQPGLEREAAQQGAGEGVDRLDRGKVDARGRDPAALARRLVPRAVAGGPLEVAADPAAELGRGRLGEGDRMTSLSAATSATIRPTRTVVLPVPAPASTKRVVSRSVAMRARSR